MCVLCVEGGKKQTDQISNVVLVVSSKTMDITKIRKYWEYYRKLAFLSQSGTGSMEMNYNQL